MKDYLSDPVTEMIALILILALAVETDSLITNVSRVTPKRLQVLWSAPGNDDNIAKKAINDVQKELSRKVEDVEPV